MNRRLFLRQGLTGLAACSAGCARRAGAAGGVSVAAAFDREIVEFMIQRNVPGGAVAVVKDGRLIYARGYGWADRDQRVPVRPGSLFRIASLSKPITAVAVLRLAGQGKLDLDAPAFPLLGLEPLPRGKGPVDPRLQHITVRQLLQHTGGWDRAVSFDPMFRARPIAEEAGTAAPADATTVIRFMLRQPLDFDPGTRYAYSNFGYCVLGRILEKITGERYEPHVQKSVLRPAGIERMRIGASLEGRQADGEVRYYTSTPDRADSVFDAKPGKVPVPYGGFHLEAMDAHGGWLASAEDLARFVTAVDGSRAPELLNDEARRILVAPPAAPVSRQPDGSVADRFYGCGWMIRPQAGDRANWWHNGSLPGTATLLVRRWDGLSWAVLFNQRSDDPRLPDTAMDPAMHRAAGAVSKWPTHDLFARP